ncbi:MAG: prepilin-type N-terminal cleavage/methylation domain-containing protein [Phycisphaerales bacterium]
MRLASPSRRARLESRPCAPGGRAFSLIELLTVVVVIGVLVALALPALAGARRSARMVKCLANMRSIEQAHTTYADAHRGALVAAGLAHGGLADPRRSWPVLLADYAGGELVLRSPGDASDQWPATEGGRHAGSSLGDYLERATTAQAASGGGPPPPVPSGNLSRWTSYGLNNYVTPNRQPPPSFMRLSAYDNMSKIQRPAVTVHFLMMATAPRGGADFSRSDHVHAEGWDDGVSPAETASAECELAAWGGTAGTSAGRANYTFLDGHAATLSFGEVYRGFEENRFYPEIAR